MFDKREPVMNEDFYNKNLDAEQEAFLKKKKNNDLKNAFKSGFGKNKISDEKKEVPSIFNFINEKNNSDNSNDHLSNNVNDGFLHQMEDFLNVAKIDNEVIKNQKENHKIEKKLEEKNIESFIENIISEATDEKEIDVANNKINESLNSINQEEKNSTYCLDEYNRTDLLEISKIYYYAEMLDKFIGQEAGTYEMLEKEPFIDLIKLELEKILRKEQHQELNLIYSTSSQGTKFSSLMVELHRNNIFMGYIDNQSKLFITEHPNRISGLNWFSLYQANYQNKVWLQPIEYSKKNNESITPWTRTGVFVWILGMFLSLIGVFFNNQKENIGTIEIYSPMLIILAILIIVSAFDYVGSLVVKIKYKKLEKTLIEIKTNVNETIVNKKDINPLMYDVCSHYIKRKNK